MQKAYARYSGIPLPAPDDTVPKDAAQRAGVVWRLSTAYGVVWRLSTAYGVVYSVLEVIERALVHTPTQRHAHGPKFRINSSLAGG